MQVTTLGPKPPEPLLMQVTAQCTEECMRVLLGEAPRPLPPGSYTPTYQGRSAVLQVGGVLRVQAARVEGKGWPGFGGLVGGWGRGDMRVGGGGSKAVASGPGHSVGGRPCTLLLFHHC